MGVYDRPDSPWFWLALERPGQRPIRERTAIPIDGGTPEQTRKNKQLAQAAYSVRMAELAQGRYRIPSDRQNPTPTFAKFRQWYEANVTVTKRNPSRERSMLGRLAVVFDALSLEQITTTHIIEWRTVRATQVQPATVNRELALLKHILSTAVTAGHLTVSPGKGVKLLRVPEQEVRILTHDEEDRLLKVCRDPVDRAIILCALDTLQRLSNIANLKRAQDHGTYISVLNPKVKGYKVPISTRLRAALDALPADGPYYFPTIHGHQDTQRNRMATLFHRLLKDADLPRYRRDGGLSFHCLRHTGASRMLARGVDIKTVAQLGGWQNIIVLQKYLHPTDAQKVAAVEAVSQREQGGNGHRPFGSVLVPGESNHPRE